MPPLTLLRDGVSDLSTLAAGDLRGLWRTVSDGVSARNALEEILPLLVRTYASAAATVASDWYDEERDEAEAPGRFRAITAPVGDSGTSELARWGVGPLFDEEPDWRRAQTLITGGVQRRIANAARDTISASSVDDPAAEGWQRAGSGECAFCAMLIGRGAVYSERSADFASHDHCNCQAVPAFRGRARPVRPYTPSSRVVTDADRARVRDYLAANDVS